MTDEIAVTEAPAKSPEQLENERLIKSFVERYEKVRRPGVTLKFLQAFLQQEAADKVRQDAQSTFSSFGTERMAALIYVVQAEMEVLASENTRKLEQAHAKIEADLKAAEEAKKAAQKAEKPAKKYGKKR